MKRIFTLFLMVLSFCFTMEAQMECPIDFSFRPKIDDNGNYQNRYEFSALAPPSFGALSWTKDGTYFGNAQNSSVQIDQPGTYRICMTAVNDSQQECEVCKDIVMEANPAPCVDIARLNYYTNCSDEVNEVCGCDGETYPNPCIAENIFGVTSWSPGPCRGQTCGVEISFIRLTDPTTGALVREVEFEAHTDPNNAYTYEWYFTDVSAADGKIARKEFANPGVYSACVSAYDAAGTLKCNTCREVAVGDVSPPPPPNCEIDFSYWPETDPNTGSHGNQLRFNANSNNGVEYIWKWNFGDGSTATGNGILHPFESGTYNVCLEAYAGNDLICTKCQDVEVVGTGPEYSVEGLLRDQANNPIAGVQVIARYHPCWSNEQITRDEYTDDNGRYYFGFFECLNPDIEVYTFCGNEEVEGEYKFTDTNKQGIIDLQCGSSTACFDPSQIDSLANCTTEYVPVCGCDGITYENACVAENWYGIVEWTEGACNTSDCFVDFDYYRESNPDGTPSNRFRFEAIGQAGVVYTYNWLMGDGNSSGSQVLNHLFTEPGTYEVCLLAYDQDGNQCEKCKDIVIEEDIPCEVDFSHLREIRTDGALSDYVDFEIHTPSDQDYLYAWDFGDNSAKVYDEARLSHKYTAAGTYKVCLKVYSSTEEFLCEICRDVVIDTAPPPCFDESQIDSTANCPSIFRPVCGCDQVTYENACEARSHGITQWTEGICPDERCQVDFEYEKVDDSDENLKVEFKAFNTRDAEFTYIWHFGNGVDAEGEEVAHSYTAASNYMVCVEAFVEGEFICIECKEIVVGDDGTSECFDPEKVDNTVVCPEVYEPVCGCDRVTYPSACEAENVYGISYWITGECPQDECLTDFNFYNQPLSDGSPSNKIRFEAIRLNTTANGLYYRWEFGDGTFGAGDITDREYIAQGTYKVCVNTFDANTFVCQTCKDIVLGEDTDICFDPNLIKDDEPCTEEYKPVCGCDGITYENACIAEKRYGINTWKDGACDQRGCQIAFAFQPDSTSTDSLFRTFYFDAWTLDGYSTKYEYRWTFGDGQEAVGQTLSHAYTAEGVYSVCVEAWMDGKYVCSWCNEVVIYDVPDNTTDGDCRLAFGYYPNGISETGGFQYKFDAWTLDGREARYEYIWTFGDGLKGEGQSIEHDYTKGDVYYVCVEAYDENGFVCSWCDEVVIEDRQDNDCQIGIEITKSESTTADNFHWYKLEAITPDGNTDRYEFKWELGDGRFGYGNALRHNYTGGGVYKVCLNAFVDDEIVCTWCEEVLIDDTPDEGCQLAFAYAPNGTLTQENLPILDFKAWTLDGYQTEYNYRWDFGDGRRTAGRETKHAYSEPGFYKVCVAAFKGEQYVCHWCNEVELEEIPREGCQIAFGYHPDLSASSTEMQYIFESWTLDGNSDKYTYKWDFGDGQGDGGQTVKNNYTKPGAYKVCVDAYEGDEFVCSWCSEVRIDQELEDEDCQISFFFKHEEPVDGQQKFYFELESLNGEVEDYTYNWFFGNGTEATGKTAEASYTEEGVYSVCVDALDSDGKVVCSWCDRIKIEDIPEWFPCDLDVAFDQDELTVGLKVLDDYVKYFWDFGDGTYAEERSVTHTYEEAGSYFICLEVVDRAGNHCSECGMVTIEKEDEVFDDPCIDESKIDFDVECSDEEKPVCGCDGVTYKNSCVAENYYGIKEWKEGSCEGEEPGDSLAICEVNFEYSAYKISDTKYKIQFNAYEGDDAIYFWDFGDGNVSTDPNPTNTYEVPAGEDFAMTACLYIIRQNDTTSPNELPYCVGRFCETLAIDDAEDAFIEGTITSAGEGFRRKIERRSGNGDPLPGVKVDLIDVFGDVVASATTDDKGEYTFEELLFGNYKVQVKIDGIEHEPFAVKLDPTNQDEEDLDFAVTEEAVNTGIEEQAFAKSINLYPNPTKGAIQLEFDLQFATHLQLKVTNLFGQTLQLNDRNFNAGTQKMDLDLSEYPSGIYMITLSTDEESFSRRVVVSRQ